MILSLSTKKFFLCIPVRYCYMYLKIPWVSSHGLTGVAAWLVYVIPAKAGIQ
ncbi:MAG: hypothetical protein ACEY3D_08470 [Rickettsia sp.]|uniref:hypothetical protein n=1 Tax=Rickettsia sp. TaxID=789 RepID=UPI00397B2551